ncbi:hypothetical protein BH11MYX4_BH11MYX4_52050 [soil metagenome]
MRSSSYRPGLVVAVLGLLAVRPAQAQGTPNMPPSGSGTPNMPPPGSGTPNMPPPNVPPPAAPAPAVPLPAPAPAPYREGEEPEQGDEGRIRVGFNLNGGIGTGSKLSGGTIGATVRLGYQIDHLIAVYGQFSPFVFFGGYSSGVEKELKLSAIGGFQLTPIFSLYPVDILELAAGPSFDNLSGGSTGGSVNNTTVTTTVTAYSGFYFGLHGRVALHIGGKPNTKTGRRVGFSIGADLHPTFAEGSTLTFITLGLGADWY